MSALSSIPDESEGSETPFTLLWDQEKKYGVNCFPLRAQHWESGDNILFHPKSLSDLRSVYLKNVMIYRVKCYIKLSDATVKEYVIIYIL